MYTPSQFPPTSVSVDLNALAQNLAHVRRLAPRSEVLAIVKANAYGHGALELTRTLQQLAVDTRAGWVVTVSAIDNLIKGAAGQAIQAMNLMLGYPEETGLVAPGIYP